MRDDHEIKSVVREKYGDIAKHSKAASRRTCACCGPSEDANTTDVSERYDGVAGYVPEADLGLGCGLPTEFADIKEGDFVVDLGSGAGNDVFVARSLVGSAGRVLGIDMTQEMIDRAEANNQRMGFDNVEFRLGEIENLPVDDNSADVVVSNCVLNLVPDKKKAFAEIHRVLKSGAHFCVSDIVVRGELPAKLRKSAEMYVGCVAGALKLNDYLQAIDDAGFNAVSVKTSKEVYLPDAVLRGILSEEEIVAFREGDTGILSITVVGYKGRQ